MVVGNVPDAVDFLVVGGGPGGYAAALHAARAGRRVLLVDGDGTDGLGGTCLNVGCIPSKALIELAIRARSVPDAAAMGIVGEAPQIDMARFQAWKQGMVSGLARGIGGLLTGAGVEVLAGRLSFTETDTAVISMPGDQIRFVRFTDVVLATGSSPIELPALPFDGERVLDSAAALALAELPGSLAVIGAGYIGLELGTALAKLGTRVTLVEAAGRILPTIAAELTAPVVQRLAALGVEVLTSAVARTVDDGGGLEVEVAGGRRRIEAERIVVAVGRRPATDGLGLEALGITPLTDGTLDVAPDRRLSAHVAAIGDLTPGPALAHKATAEAAVAVASLCGNKAAFDPAAIPAIVFSDPEIATAGLGTAEAREQGIDADVTEVPLAAIGRAATLDQRRGFARIVSDREDGTVLGVQVVAPHASELIAEGVLAIEMGVTLEDLSLVIHPHPTLGEVIAEAAHLGIGAPIHVPDRVRRD